MRSEQDVKNFTESEIYQHPNRYPITDKGLCIQVGEYDEQDRLLVMNHVFFKKGLILNTWEKWEFDYMERKTKTMQLIK